ncbi:hypothetical protein SAMN06272721_1241, partial [Arthrobacter sp. P2b]
RAVDNHGCGVGHNAFLLCSLSTDFKARRIDIHRSMPRLAHGGRWAIRTSAAVTRATPRPAGARLRAGSAAPVSSCCPSVVVRAGEQGVRWRPRMRRERAAAATKGGVWQPLQGNCKDRGCCLAHRHVGRGQAERALETSLLGGPCDPGLGTEVRGDPPDAEDALGTSSATPCAPAPMTGPCNEESAADAGSSPTYRSDPAGVPSGSAVKMGTTAKDAATSPTSTGTNPSSRAQ